MNDIVERLRGWAEAHLRYLDRRQHVPPLGLLPSEAHRAADEIERLRDAAERQIKLGRAVEALKTVYDPGVHEQRIQIDGRTYRSSVGLVDAIYTAAGIERQP